jgi:hypothetical protein
MHGIEADILDWANRIIKWNPGLVYSVFLAFVIPCMVAYRWQAIRLGKIKTKFGWVIRRNNPRAFRWTMRYLLGFIVVLIAFFIFTATLAVRAYLS